MKKLKLSLFLIILGNILYLLHRYIFDKLTSPLGEFTSGLLLGISIGINLIGIILTISYIKEQEKK